MDRALLELDFQIHSHVCSITNCCNAKRNLACDAIWIPFVNLGEFRVSLFRKKNITPSLILHQDKSIQQTICIYLQTMYRLYTKNVQITKIICLLVLRGFERFFFCQIFFHVCNLGILSIGPHNLTIMTMSLFRKNKVFPCRKATS